MKKALCLLLCFAIPVSEIGAANVVVDAQGNVINSAPTNFPTGKLKVNGVEITPGGGGGGSVATDTIFDAKGDLPVGTGANTAVRLAIGANNTIAIADSAQTTGIRWGDPASIRTALGLVIGTNVQAFDGDLLSLANAEATHQIYYKSEADTWAKLKIGPGLSFIGNTLSILRVDEQISPTDDIVATTTLALAGLERSEIDVTGSTTITSITGLDDGEEILLRFVDGLTLTQGASLQLLGGVDTIAPANSWGRFRRDGSVVTAIDFQYEDGSVMADITGGFIRTAVLESCALNENKSFSLRSFDSSGYVRLFFNSTQTADRDLNIALYDADRQIILGGDLSIQANFSTFGENFPISLTATAASDATLPEGTYTLAKVNSETFTDATINGLDVSGAIDLTGIITPPALTADVNDYAPAGFATASTLRVATDGLGDRTITGLASGTAGKLVILYNDDVGSNINLTAFDASSADANQLTGQYSLQPFQSTLLRYDATLLKWIPLAQPPTPFEATPWGFIGGTLGDQTDLQDALDDKLSLTGGTLTGNLAAPNARVGFTTTATAAGTTTLTVNSTQLQYFTGATTQICKLPVTSTLILGHSFTVVNLSGGAVTVNSSGNNAVKILNGVTSAVFTCILITGTTAASWNADYNGAAYTTGTKMTFPTTTAAIARTDAAQTFTGVQTMTSPAITTPVITGLATGNGVSETATASTLVARDANGDSTSGNFISSVAGKGLQLQSGTGARAGNATLVGGTVTVTNTTVNSTNDILLMTRKTSGGTIGMALTYTLSNGASFTINSDNVLDTSVISYMLVKVN